MKVTIMRRIAAKVSYWKNHAARLAYKRAYPKEKARKSCRENMVRRNRRSFQWATNYRVGWSDEDKAMLKVYSEMTLETQARLLNRTCQAVASQRHRLGISKCQSIIKPLNQI